MRLLIVGAGSTGGYLGARLAQAGRDITFLVRPTRALQLRETGLRIQSAHGDATLYPTLVTAGEIAQPYDAVLLAVKGYQLANVLEDIAPAVGPETMILPVLNGMGHMETLARRFTKHNLVGCTLKVATVLEDDGRIVQLSPMQDFAFGELDGGVTSRIEALDAFFRDANIGARLSRVIGREMWEKWILLASVGAITCLTGGTIGEIEACTGGASFALQLLEEIVTIVKVVGEPPSDTFLHLTREQLTAKGSPFVSSMFRDVQRGRPVEVEEIIGALVRHAGEAGIATPLLSAAYVKLLVYQHKVR
ncbi:ketopantoate reductase family protein [Paraburkholderia sp. XV]|uniref:ketopantoate reductase family protein n=1 Tax=Paraburkholderia sp. XV TaxID=2831520 RepID=UPI001CD41533|nr:ketopantoate reductase family protein [Paraburkholderia sp. XV]